MRIQSCSTLRTFLKDQGGNTTTDWTAVTALAIGIGIAFLFALFGTIPVVAELAFGAALLQAEDRS